MPPSRAGCRRLLSNLYIYRQPNNTFIFGGGGFVPRLFQKYVTSFPVCFFKIRKDPDAQGRAAYYKNIPPPLPRQTYVCNSHSPPVFQSENKKVNLNSQFARCSKFSVLLLYVFNMDVRNVFDNFCKSSKNEDIFCRIWGLLKWMLQLLLL